MKSKEAFKAICEAIEADPAKQINDSAFDEKHFGSFFVSFEESGEPRCLVNDRGFLFLTGDARGTGPSITTLPSLHDADLEALGRLLNP